MAKKKLKKFVVTQTEIRYISAVVRAEDIESAADPDRRSPKEPKWKWRKDLPVAHAIDDIVEEWPK